MAVAMEGCDGGGMWGGGGDGGGRGRLADGAEVLVDEGVRAEVTAVATTPLASMGAEATAAAVKVVESAEVVEPHLVDMVAVMAGREARAVDRAAMRAAGGMVVAMAAAKAEVMVAVVRAVVAEAAKRVVVMAVAVGLGPVGMVVVMVAEAAMGVAKVVSKVVEVMAVETVAVMADDAAEEG